MELEGIIFMTLGWGMAISLLSYCIYKITKTGGGNFNAD